MNLHEKLFLQKVYMEHEPMITEQIEIPQDAMIVMDWDDVLFDRRKFDQAIEQSSSDIGFVNAFFRLLAKLTQKEYSLIQIYEFYEGFRDKAPHWWFKPLCKELELEEKKVLEEVKKLINSHPTGFMFDDAIEFLKQAGQKWNKIYILSAWPTDLQKVKIKSALKKKWLNIPQEQIIIVSSKDAKIEKLERISRDNQGKQVWFLDDRLPQWVDEVAQVVPVLVAREGVEPQWEEFGEHRINSLEQIRFSSQAKDDLTGVLGD